MSGPSTATSRVDGGRTPSATANVRYRLPTAGDGRDVHRLVHESGGLEPNTGYAYVLLCDHFAATTVLAEMDGELAGFVAAYVPPDRDDTVFVWQIGVSPNARGLGIASSLLDALLAREACRSIAFLEATVTPSNTASRRLFESFAERHGAVFTWADGYAAHCFDGPHEPEHLIRVGPLRAPIPSPSSSPTRDHT